VLPWLAGADLPAAIDHLGTAVELTAVGGANYRHVHALVRLAAARHRNGEPEAAHEALRQAQADLVELPDPGMLERLYADTRDRLAGGRHDAHRGDELSDAERRVLEHLLSGRSVRETAHELWLSPNTIKTHRRRIYRKLGVETREQLLARALLVPGVEGATTYGTAHEWRAPSCDSASRRRAS
jgi:DNA-binding CsgD family transcriptional regulator